MLSYEFEEDPESSIKLSDYHYEDYRIYDIHHEMVVHSNGKVFGKVFTKYNERFNFKSYMTHDSDVLFMRIGKHIANDFIEKCNVEVDDLEDFDCDRMSVDFHQVKYKMRTITGAWFGKMKTDFVKSSAYFGRKVDASHLFEDAEKTGEISMLIFEYIFKGETIKVGVTKDAAIVIYNKIPDQKLELMLVEQIFTNFVLPCIV